MGLGMDGGRRGKLTVEECSSGQVHVHHAMVGAVFLLGAVAETQVGDDAVNAPDRAVRDEFPDLDAQWEVSRPHRLHQEQVLRLGRLHQLFGLGRVDGEGLLTQDVLASLQTKHGVLVVV